MCENVNKYTYQSGSCNCDGVKKERMKPVVSCLVGNFLIQEESELCHIVMDRKKTKEHVKGFAT